MMHVMLFVFERRIRKLCNCRCVPCDRTMNCVNPLEQCEVVHYCLLPFFVSYRLVTVRSWEQYEITF
jgi:hypothetical protein